METINLQVPELDQETLKNKAYEYAMKGAEEVLKDYYSGYKSPYKQKFEEALNAMPFNSNFNLLDMTAYMQSIINEKAEEVCSLAVAQVYIPELSEFLTGLNRDRNNWREEIRFSEIVKKFKEIVANDDDEIKNVFVEAVIDKEYEPYNVYFSKNDSGLVSIDYKDKAEYCYTLHAQSIYEEGKFKKTGKYQLLSVDNNNEYKNKRKQTIKIKTDDITAEIPFDAAALKDKFHRYIISLYVNKIAIIMDDDYDTHINREED
jgi:hypothetical protein